LHYSSFQITYVKAVADDVFEIRLSSDTIALYVWLSAGDSPGWFSENGFLLVSSQATVTFQARGRVSILQFQKKLMVKCLTDI
jgi:hypothetical protein